MYTSPAQKAPAGPYYPQQLQQPQQQFYSYNQQGQYPPQMQSPYYPQQLQQSYPSSQYYPQQPQPQFVMMPGQPNLNQYGMKSQVELQPMGRLQPQLVVTTLPPVRENVYFMFCLTMASAIGIHMCGVNTPWT